MQTFHTSLMHLETAIVLDVKRRAKQIVECKQILQILEAIESGYIYKKTIRSPYPDGAVWMHTTTDKPEEADRTKKGKPKTIGHLNHPTVKRWMEHKGALIDYMATLHEYHENNKYGKWLKIDTFSRGGGYLPDWLTEDFCKQHRILLYKKMPEHYSKYWDERGELV